MPCVYLPGPAPAVTVANNKYQYIVAKCSTGAYIYYILVTILPIDIVT